jgi:putative PIN family toxin of toxin-antitoxin system
VTASAGTRTGTSEAVPVALLAPPLRVVLDTNVLLSLYVFADSRLAAISGELTAGRWLALTNESCLAEYERVLGYPEFHLSEVDQERALAAYLSVAKCLNDTTPRSQLLPICHDPDDQKFLELARDGAADYLVSADRALLKLARHKRLDNLFRVVMPDAAMSLIDQ